MASADPAAVADYEAKKIPFCDKGCKVCIVGGSGFIGSWLGKKLKELGYYVIVADLKKNAFMDENEYCHEFKEIDMRKLENCLEATKDCTHVYNLASDMGGDAKQSEVLYSNAMLSYNVLEAAKVNGAKRYFCASTFGVYNEDRQKDAKDSKLKEGLAWPAKPKDTCGLERLCAEQMAINYAKDFGIESRMARYYNVFAPQGGQEKAPVAFCRKALTSTTEFEIEGDGKETRSFTFIDDCVEGTIRIMMSDCSEPLNLGSTEMMSMDDLAKLVLSFEGKSTPIKHLPGPEAVKSYVSDNEMIKAKLGWEPPTKLADSLKTIYTWSKEQLEKEALEKQTAIIEGLLPGEWFTTKASEWSTLKNEVRKKHQEYRQKRKEKPELEDAAAAFNIKGMTIEDIHNIDGKSTPIYGNFMYEDWLLLAWRYELHLLAHAFEIDANDSDKPGIPEQHLAHYYNVYFKSKLDPAKLGCDNYQKVFKLLKLPAVQFIETAKTKFLKSELDKEMPLKDFIIGVEDYRRNRMRRIDAGDESAQLKFPKGEPAKAGGKAGAPAKAGTPAKTNGAADAKANGANPPSAKPAAPKPVSVSPGAAAAAGASAVKRPAPPSAAPPDAKRARSEGDADVAKAPVAKAPVTKAPVTKAPVTKAPVTKAPVTKAPVGKAPVGKAPIAKRGGAPA